MKMRTKVIILALLMHGYGCTPDSGEPAAAMEAAPALASPEPEAVITLRDVQSGKVDIRVFADAETTALWHKHTIRSIERTMLPDRRPMTDNELEHIFRQVTHDPGVALPFPIDVSRWTVAMMMGKPLVALAPVGMLLLARDGNYQPECSAILSRNDMVITAGHCVHEDSTTPAAWKVYVPFEGIRDIEQITPYCPDGNDTCSAEIDDLATMRLTHPFEFAPIAQQGASSAASVGELASILGFGITHETKLDFGILREGRASLQACLACDETAVLDGRRMCFTFTTSSVTNLEPTPGLQGNLSWDSGGPMLAENTLRSLIGVASKNNSCGLEGEKEGRYVNVTHSTYHTWRDSALCAAPCLTTVSSDQPEWPVIVPGKYIDLPSPAGDADSDSHTFTVGDGSRKLIVAMNHETLGYTNTMPSSPKADLEIEMPDALEGSLPCERHWGAEVCTVDDPEPGAYELRVNRVKGNPLYQLTVVVIRCPTAEC